MTGVQTCALPILGTYASLLNLHTHGRSLSKGKRIHAHIVHHGHDHQIYLNNLLVLMYGKCGDLPDARAIFVRMPTRNAFSWNIMMGACIQNKANHEAIKVFSHMSLHGMKPDKVTFLGILSICANQATLRVGKYVHNVIVEDGIELDITIGTALLHMYGRCGTLNQAREVFERLPKRNIVAWSAMISTYGQHGEGHEAVRLFRHMQQEGIIPCEIAFIAILSACSRTGLIDEGCYFFSSMFMLRHHGINPSEEHYNCMIDLLGRAGRLNESERLLRSFEPSLMSWITLFGACKVNLDLPRAIRVVEHILALDPGNSILHKLLTMIYSIGGSDLDAYMF